MVVEVTEQAAEAVVFLGDLCGGDGRGSGGEEAVLGCGWGVNLCRCAGPEQFGPMESNSNCKRHTDGCFFAQIKNSGFANSQLNPTPSNLHRDSY